MRKWLLLVFVLLFVAVPLTLASAAQSGDTGFVLVASVLPSQEHTSMQGSTDAQAAMRETEAKEAETLAALRSLQLDIARKAAEADQLVAEQEQLQERLVEIEGALQEERKRYRDSSTALGNVLTAWQTAGPGSRLELLLSSNSLSLFLQRLSAMRQLDRDMDALLEQLEQNLIAMDAQKARQQEAITALEHKGAEIGNALRAMELEESRLETALAALQAERGKYEMMLAELGKTWEKALLVFPQLTKSFTRVIETGSFPDDALEIRFELDGMKAVMREDRFQSILDNAEDLPPLTFQFEKGYVRLLVPEAELDLRGVFEVRKGVTLVYRPTSGSQGSLTLTPEQLGDLSQKGALEFRLEPILMGTTIRDAVSENDMLHLSISMDFFW